MLQNALVIDCTVFELVRENQNQQKGVNLVPNLKISLQV